MIAQGTKVLNTSLETTLIKLGFVRLFSCEKGGSAGFTVR